MRNTCALDVKAAYSLASALVACGCNVSYAGVISKDTIQKWVEVTTDQSEALSAGEEPVFSYAELFAISELSEEIAVILNDNKV